MVSPFSVHQQQLAVLAQQQSLLMAAAAKSGGIGATSSSPGKTYLSRSNDAQAQLLSGNLPVQNWLGFQVPGMRMPVGGLDDLQKYMQAECYKPLHCSVDAPLVSCLIIAAFYGAGGEYQTSTVLGESNAFSSVWVYSHLLQISFHCLFGHCGQH